MGKPKLQGEIFFGRNGRAKVRLPNEDIISLARGRSGTALHGDMVELYRLPPKKKDKKKKSSGPPAYQVHKVLRRGTDEFLGHFS
ncbi:MAG: hypothetical protein VW312_04875, partial [Opitutales bacterium]